MPFKDRLLEEYLRVKAETNDHRRGYAFQKAVGRLFEKAQFQVIENAGAARPRQTDLFASRGSDAYLIEAKWRKKRVANIDDIDSLASRLNRVESAVVGVFFSASGFSSSVIRFVEEHRTRPILLFDRNETERLFEGLTDLSECLNQKREQLRVHGKVLLGSDPPPRRRSPRRLKVLHALDDHFIQGDGELSKMIACRGDFSQFVFADELPDIDWVTAGGNGVVIDLSLTADNQMDLVHILETLAVQGWITDAGRWSINQSTTKWLGAGAHELSNALLGWENRYAELSAIHHTEEVCYQDVAEGGFYTLTADVSASDDRRTWGVDLSLQLIGTPLNTDSIQYLAEGLHAATPAYFRPLGERSIRTVRFTPSKSHDLAVVGFIVRKEPELSRDPLWTTAVVVRNPWFGDRSGSATGAPDEDWVPVLSQCELLVCALRSHHPSSEMKENYYLHRCDWTWTSDALVLRPVAEWD